MNESSTPEGPVEPEETSSPRPVSDIPQPAAAQPESANPQPASQSWPESADPQPASQPWPLGPTENPSAVPPAGSPPPPPNPAAAPGGWWYQPGPPTGQDPYLSPGAGAGAGGYGGGYPPNYSTPGGPGQGGAMWSPGPSWQPPVPPRRPRRGFRPLAAAALVVATAAAGVGIGHLVWAGTAPSAPIASRQPAGSGSGGTTNPFGGSGSPFGNSGSPFGNSGSPFGNGGSSPFGNGGTSNGSGSTGPAAGSPSDVNRIAAKVDPALVDINLGYKEDPGVSGAGTGIVLTSNGEILTNNHVITMATSISVTDLGNGKTYTGKVVGYDSSADVAVIQLQGASGLKTAKLGNSSKLKVGEGVVAIGNAGGKGGTPTAAGGSVTGLNKAITASDELTGTSEPLTGLIQTNADVQEGDSGGSLVNSSGQVIGMDTAGSGTYSLSSQATQGFAIPINKALAIATQIESGRSSSTVHVGPTAFLGVSISSSGSSSYPYSGGSSTPAAGVQVGGVIAGTAAQRAGLAQGDVITSFAGHTLSSPSDLTKLIEQYKPGDSVTIGWTDTSGQTHTATVTLGTGPAQ